MGDGLGLLANVGCAATKSRAHSTSGSPAAPCGSVVEAYPAGTYIFYIYAAVAKSLRAEIACARD